MALLGRPTREDDERAAAWARWLHQRNPLAIASLVLGVFSLIEFGALLVFGIAGVVLGAIALVQLRQNPAAKALALHTAEGQTSEPMRGQALAWSGIALSVASLILAAVLYLLPRHALGAAGGGAP
jgi:hypothetical protein